MPRLITGSEPPEPVLPTRYDISVGQKDERDAIMAGTLLKAAELHLQRLVAAIIRRDLADLVAQLEGSPDPEQISAWLADLTDAKVRERMSRLSATDDYQPGVMIRTDERLKSMRNEALEFGKDSTD